MYTLLGCIGFLFLFLGDLNDWKQIAAPLRVAFPLGFFLLTAATATEIVRSGVYRIAYLILAVPFLILMVYALFFAIPTMESYVEQTPGRPVCSKGLYALCRHPGVLCFIGLYLFLCLGTGLSVRSASVYCLLNVLLVVFEDILVFPATIGAYEEYKKTTPFLIPTPTSIRPLLKK